MRTVLFIFLILCYACSDRNKSVVVHDIEDYQTLPLQVSFMDSILDLDWIKDPTVVRSFYINNDYRTFWFNEKNRTSHMDTFRAYVDSTDPYHLSPFAPRLKEIINPLNLLTAGSELKETELKLMDIRMTQAFIDYVYQNLHGELPQKNSSLWKIEGQEREVRNLIAGIQTSEDLIEVLRFTEPRTPHYHLLKAKFRELINYPEDSIRAVSLRDARDLTFLNPTDQRRMQNRLQFFSGGQMDEIPADPGEALNRFEELMEIDTLPKVRESTLTYLELPLEDLRRLMRLNLERFRLMPQFQESRHVLVNLPAFKLLLMEGKEVEKQMAVVTGTDYNPTPVFTDTITYLVFNPTWTVPESIIGDEMIPNLRLSSEHYQGRDFLIYKDGRTVDPVQVNWEEAAAEEYMFVQQSGTSNALGRVKFIMPNAMHIYLHDTPSDHLFDRKERAFSHGCIRLEEPFDLALEFLNGGNRDSLNAVLKSGETRRVYLDEGIPTHLLYVTSWPDANGRLYLEQDVYGLDQSQLDAIAETRIGRQ
jgi:murein L,D-transpeptidase YcbB/YkuD